MRRLVYPNDLLGPGNDISNIIKLNIVSIEGGKLEGSGGPPENPNEYQSGEVKGSHGTSSYGANEGNSFQVPSRGNGFNDFIAGVTGQGQQEPQAPPVEIQFTSGGGRTTHTEIFFPAPALLPFTHRSNYSQGNLGGFHDLGDQKFTDILKTGYNQLMRGQSPDAIFNLIKDMVTPTVRSITTLGSEELGNAIDYRTRSTRNSHVKVLYEGPDFRLFNFVMPLVPYEATDSETIRQIVETLYYHFSPGYANRYDGHLGADNFWAYPDEVEIEILMKDPETGMLKVNPYIPKMRRSVVTSIEATYGGNSMFTTHKSGAPLETVLQMSFMETEYLTKDLVQEDFYQGSGNTSAPGSVHGRSGSGVVR